MRLALVLALILTLFLGLAASPAAAAAERKPAACTKKANKMKGAQRRVAALRKCRGAACTARAKRIKSARRRAAAVRRCRRPMRGERRPVRPNPAPAPAVAPAAPRIEGGLDDVTVVAVLDGGINPYHWDFLSAKLPQHQDGAPGNDIPLDRPAIEWLPGMGGFSSFEPIALELDESDPDAGFGPAEPLEGLKGSSASKLQAYWLPGTKVIGAMIFGDGDEPRKLWQGPRAHGVGTTSSLVGNIHGTCPECLLFFIDYGHTSAQAEAAIEWAESQPWIDVISNSYGHGGTVPKIYAGSNVEAQRRATERGQEIVFSGGNGIENAYAASNPTNFSSQKGPDWILTVGATTPGEDNHYGNDSNGGAYSGAGKPVDVAGVGIDYPNAYGATSVAGVGSGFSGSSNAAPTVAGLYARSLYLARTALGGPSRVQEGGIIAQGAPVACGPARAGCELGDGRLTEVELRTRLLHGAVHSEGGTAVYDAGAGVNPTVPPVDELDLLGEGHGTYFARQAGPGSGAWLDEVERIVGPMTGRIPALERPAGEREWFVVDSYCRQDMWGAWKLGYYVAGETELPGPDSAWPVRSAHEETCLGGPTPLG